ncbi:hypothetical protein Tco_0791365 [Tanacetum coccineum]
MGEPLSLDRVFDFPEDELEPHPAYDFFAPAPLPGYAGNPNYNNGWLAADDYLLGELEAMADQQMVVPAVDEIAEQVVIPAIEEVAEPVVEADEEQVIAPVVDVAEGQMDAPIMDIEEDLAALFDDDDFEDDASDGFGKEEVWEIRAIKGVNLILTLKRDLLEDIEIPKMAVKKTSFPEMECSGSIVVSIPDVVEGKSEKFGDTSRMIASFSILEEPTKVANALS